MSVGRRLRWFLVALGLLLFVVVLAVVVLAASSPRPLPSDDWLLGDDLAVPRGELAGAMVTLDGREHIAAVGGLFGFTARGSTDVGFYDPRLDIWQSAPRLPASRHHLGAAGIRGTLYVAGGGRSAADWSPRTEVWRLLPGATSWEAAPALPEGRLGHRLVAIGETLYVIGGVGGASVLILDTGDPDAHWLRGADMPQPRDHLGAVVVDGQIWAVGGRSEQGNHSRVDIYDPAEDRWHPGPELPEPTSAAAVGLVGGWVVVYGGEDAGLFGGVIDRHWRLEPGEGRWEQAPAPPLAVHGAADGVAQGVLVIAGGASRHGLLSPLAWTGVTQTLRNPPGHGP